MLRTPYYQKIENNLHHNKAHFSAYLDYLENAPDLSKSGKVYLSRITVFLLLLDKLEIDIEELPSINYIIEIATKHGKDLDGAFKAALKLFFSIARQTTNVQITDEEIDEFDFKKDNTRQASPLTTKEIIEIRNELRRENNYQFLFVFEVFLTYGIDLDQFQQIKKENFSLGENIFYTTSGGVKVLGRSLTELIINHDDLPKAKIRWTLQEQIKQIGKLIERDKLIWQDIIATRKEHFPACPDCNEKYPNTDDFWVLLEYQFDESKMRWILCRACAKRRMEGQINGQS